ATLASDRDIPKCRFLCATDLLIPHGIRGILVNRSELYQGRFAFQTTDDIESGSIMDTIFQ
ncbi:MAG: hypothetical protein JXL85_00450, partial [Bacilli bacterium]|nr:hypothetical protein [Bacilli bacterium]